MPGDTAEGMSQEPELRVQYLEYVTSDVDATCAALTATRGLTFGEPVPELGNARTAALEGGGLVGVRAQMHTAEGNVVRPYILVDDIDAVLVAVQAQGGELALPATEIPGGGQYAIYMLGGNQHGLWEL